VKPKVLFLSHKAINDIVYGDGWQQRGVMEAIAASIGNVIFLPDDFALVKAGIPRPAVHVLVRNAQGDGAICGPHP